MQLVWVTLACTGAIIWTVIFYKWGHDDGYKKANLWWLRYLNNYPNRTARELLDK